MENLEQINKKIQEADKAVTEWTAELQRLKIERENLRKKNTSFSLFELEKLHTIYLSGLDNSDDKDEYYCNKKELHEYGAEGFVSWLLELTENEVKRLIQ
jgi:hypothetical protein